MDTLTGMEGKIRRTIKALDWLLEKVIEDHHDTTDDLWRDSG